MMEKEEIKKVVREATDKHLYVVNGNTVEAFEKTLIESLHQALISDVANANGWNTIEQIDDIKNIKGTSLDEMPTLGTKCEIILRGGDKSIAIFQEYEKTQAFSHTFRCTYRETNIDYCIGTRDNHILSCPVVKYRVVK